MTETLAIATPTTKSVTRWSEPSLPVRLRALLDQKLTLADMPVIGPKSATELRAYIAACQPPSPTCDEIENMLGKLSIALPKAIITDVEAQHRLVLYHQALRHHALPDLHAVFGVLLRTCRFFPTIAEIEAAVAPLRARRMARVNRASLLILKHEREWTPPIDDPVDPKEIEDLRARTSASLGADQTSSNERPQE